MRIPPPPSCHCTHYLENEVGKPGGSQNQVGQPSTECHALQTHHQDHAPKLSNAHQLERSFQRHFKLIVIDPRVHQDSVILASHSKCTLQSFVLPSWAHFKGVSLPGPLSHRRYFEGVTHEFAEKCLGGFGVGVGVGVGLRGRQQRCGLDGKGGNTL